MLHSMNDNNPLSGVTVLIVEDDLLLAMDLEETLGAMGATIVDVCRTLDEGLARADADDFAVAVLDFSLGLDSVAPLARRLALRNAPFILHTGMSRSEPSLMEWGDFIIVEKPASARTLATAIKSVLDRKPARRRDLR
jgi:DNA-binding response OmpR family regulator